MSYIFLQQYWWFIISLLGALLVFLLFVQGGQTLIHRVGKTTDEQSQIVEALAHKWEYTFTTLVVFGGAFFASFPLFYSTSFGGAYWVWMCILFTFILQAVSYQFRSKPGNILGTRTYDFFLEVNGFVGVLLIGTAVGTFFTGSPFTVEKANISNIQMPVISNWQSGWHGLEAVADWRNVVAGLSVMFLARVLGALFIINHIHNDMIFQRAKKQLLYNAIPFVVFFVVWILAIFMSKGYAFNPTNMDVYMAPYKYFFNILDLWWNGLLLLIGVVLVLYGILETLYRPLFRMGFWISSVGTVMTVLSLFMIAGYNNTCYYPSNYDLESSLNIYNSSSSYFTLKVMSVVSLFIPIVVAYIIYVWRIFEHKHTTDKTHEGAHIDEKY